MGGPPRWLMVAGMICGAFAAVFVDRPFAVTGAAAAGFLFARLVATRVTR